MFRLEDRKVGPRRNALLFLIAAATLVGFVALPALASQDDSTRDGDGCRMEQRQCRIDARQEHRSCAKACDEGDEGDEGDDGCHRECRQAHRGASRQCRLEKLECRTEARDDLDPECTDACLGEIAACMDERGECVDACPEISRSAIEACLEGPREDVRACLREAHAEKAGCARTCREGTACWQEFRSCASECVVTEDDEEAGALE